MKNIIKMQYPYDGTGKSRFFDGTVHEIIPKDIYRIEIYGVEYFLMYYVDLKYKRTFETILVKDGDTYVKVPLDNYDYVDSYLLERKFAKQKLQKVKIDLPSEIGCTRTQMASSLFLSSPNPPEPPHGGNYDIKHDEPKKPVLSAAAGGNNPPDDGLKKDDIETIKKEDEMHYDYVYVYVPVSGNGEINVDYGLFTFFNVTQKNKYIFAKIEEPYDKIKEYALKAFQDWQTYKSNREVQILDKVSEIKREYEYVKKPDGRTLIIKYYTVTGLHSYRFVFSEYLDIDDISKLEDIYWLEIDPLNTMNRYLEDISFLDPKSHFRQDLNELFFRSGKGLLPTVYANKNMVVVDMDQRRR